VLVRRSAEAHSMSLNNFLRPLNVSKLPLSAPETGVELACVHPRIIPPLLQNIKYIGLYRWNHPERFVTAHLTLEVVWDIGAHDISPSGLII